MTPLHIRSPVPKTQNLKGRKKAGQRIMTEVKSTRLFRCLHSAVLANQGGEAVERRQAAGVRGGWGRDRL